MYSANSLPPPSASKDSLSLSFRQTHWRRDETTFLVVCIMVCIIEWGARRVGRRVVVQRQVTTVPVARERNGDRRKSERVDETCLCDEDEHEELHDPRR